MTTRKPRSVQLAAKLKELEAELVDAKEAEYAAILAEAAKVQHDYVMAGRRRKEFVKRVLALPSEQRPTLEMLGEAMKLSRQNIYQLRDSK